MRRLPFAKLLLLTALTTLAALPSQANAQEWERYDYENLAFSGIGVWLFGILPAHSEFTPALQVRADLGLLGPNVRITPSVTFWSSDLRESEIEQLEDRLEDACENGGAPCPGIQLGEVSLSDLSLDIDAQYLWTTSFGVEPYAGLGVGIHLVNGRGDVIEDTFVEDVLDAITPGINVMAGLELPLGPNLRLQGELRGVMAGSTRWIGAGVGGSWTFPQGPARPATTTTAAGGRR